MSDDSTLNSRLRKLVAKTFRAEQLYSSMRNSTGLRADALAAAANDLRAREWQSAHSTLRSALNETLSLTSRNAVAAKVGALCGQFDHQAKEAAEVLERGLERLHDTAERQEFVHLLKLTYELIQHKARSQAAQVISDELKAVLSPGEKSSISGYEVENTTAAEVPREIDSQAEMVRNSNVIPLRRQAGGRGGKE